jgi:hypothetical protein
MENMEQQFPNLSNRLINQIFPESVKAVSEGICPLPECRQPIRMDEFKDEISRREYRISGLCQKCQDMIFNSMTEEMDETLDQEPQE